MREETRVRIYQTAAAVIVVVTMIAVIDLIAHAQEPDPIIWLILDGTAVGTVEPGSFEYDLAANTISVDTNELIYGCRQAVIFRDRFGVKP